jgi:hypothetical protein
VEVAAVTEVPRRRRRVRSGHPPVAEPLDGTDTGVDPADLREADVDDAVAVVHTVAVADEVRTPEYTEVAGREVVEADTLPAERGLRGLVGGGSSQVSPGAALRARDAARPRPEDLERAEANLAIVRRNWSPRE